MSRNVGQLIIIIGVVLVVVGLLASRGWLGWFGHLPGDIRIERPGVRVYFPIVTMVLLSVGISIVLYLLRR